MISEFLARRVDKREIKCYNWINKALLFKIKDIV